jgi:hypothetical protein
MRIAIEYQYSETTRDLLLMQVHQNAKWSFVVTYSENDIKTSPLQNPN